MCGPILGSLRWLPVSNFQTRRPGADALPSCCDLGPLGYGSRRHRLGVRRLAPVDDRATSRVSRDAARAREAPAVRDWRIGVAARGHSDRTACGSIRSATRTAALCVWHMAAHVPPRRVRTQARVHVLQARGRAPRTKRTRTGRISCSWRQARATSCPTRTGCEATSISFWSTRRSHSGWTITISSTSMASNGSHQGIRCCEERDRVRASASARSLSSMRQGREDF